MKILKATLSGNENETFIMPINIFLHTYSSNKHKKFQGDRYPFPIKYFDTTFSGLKIFRSQSSFWTGCALISNIRSFRPASIPRPPEMILREYTFDNISKDQRIFVDEYAYANAREGPP